MECNNEQDPSIDELVEELIEHDSLIGERTGKCNVSGAQGNFTKAKVYYKRMLERQTKESGEDDLSVATTLYQIGTYLTLEGNIDEALEMLERALKLQLETLGEGHDDTALTYQLLGTNFLNHRENEQAEEMFRKALHIKLDILRQIFSNLTGLCRQLMNSLKGQEKYSEAIEIQKLVLENLLQMHGEDHPDVVQTYLGIAGLLGDQARLDDSLHMVDRCVEICSRLQGTEDFHPRILTQVLFHKATCLEAQGDFEGAEGVLAELRLVQKETLSETHPLVAETAEAYDHLAKLYGLKGMLDNAINAYATATNIRKTALGNGHPSTKKSVIALKALKRQKTARALNQEGLVRKAQGDSEGALQPLRRGAGYSQGNLCSHKYGECLREYFG
ncbi:unnamed protein product [Cylindrotheca closterium]|uniref:Kinesin light chain n=1 Tax=Cylindrotheca closterium TaxID=2856 RepID=A0AAD2JJJ6_9STRA|nr:unnamed protein product [Cylindrotheca closterium]